MTANTCFVYVCSVTMLFPGSSAGKESACKAETLVLFLGQEDPLEKETATHPFILAWRIPMNRGAWQARFHGVAKSWTQLSLTNHTAQHNTAQLSC